MIILGINAFHADSSACLLIDGQLISAVEEERFNRIKHWSGFPKNSISFCLDNSNLKISDIDHISVNTDPNFNFYNKLFYTLKNRPSFNFLYEKIKNKKRKINVNLELKKIFPDQVFSGETHYIEHHLSHIASAHLNSDFDTSIGFSMDGFGDFSSAAWGICERHNIDIDTRILFPHSMGIFYQSMTQFLGFPNYGDEYKVMGLAPYGKPNFLNKLREMVAVKDDGKFELNLKYFRHHKDTINFNLDDGSPNFLNLFNANEMIDLLGINPRNKEDELNSVHKNLASSIQALYEEVFFKMINSIYSKYKIGKLSLSGGCAMNSVANGKIFRNSKFTDVYIPASSGDAGGSIGSAFIVNSKINKNKSRFHKKHAYLGPSFNNEFISKQLDYYKKDFKVEKCKISKCSNNTDLSKIIANQIAQGKVIGWFQGAMEWGPRALGNRSILGDPRNKNMKDILNIKIKRRESFRPFAPSILRDKSSEWFEEDYDVPFMMQVFQVKESKKDLIPAVTHSDGSGRLQTVTAESNFKYYNLISAFNDLTGVPVILNTSFNENEPIVCEPKQAIETFLRTRMDVLVLEDWIIQREFKH
ncbi:carbamoyltransferase [Pelagibacterales bacterium]|nr:carbamoyltransferase [Pelagibacterales bacterium]